MSQLRVDIFSSKTKKHSAKTVDHYFSFHVILLARSSHLNLSSDFIEKCISIKYPTMNKILLRIITHILTCPSHILLFIGLKGFLKSKFYLLKNITVVVSRKMGAIIEEKRKS